MATSLLDWIMDLMRDGSAREAFNANPQAAMASAGFTSVCGSDVRPFLFDEPSIREVGGVEFPEVQGESAPDITYIINNYTIEAPTTNGNNVIDGGNVIDGPTDDGPETGPITGDGNTVTQEEANTTTQEDNDTDTEVENEADNVVTGDGSAGDDRITDSTLTGDISEGIFQGDGNTNLLVLQENLNDLHVLSDLVEIEDTLNGSLNGSLNNLATNALQQATDLVDVL